MALTTDEQTVLFYDKLIHQLKNQLCVLKTIRQLIQNMEDSVSTNIDLLNVLIEKLPDEER